MSKEIVLNDYTFLVSETDEKGVIDFVNDTFLNLSNYDYLAQKSIRKDGFVEVIEDPNLQSDEKFISIFRFGNFSFN